MTAAAQLTLAPGRRIVATEALPQRLADLHKRLEQITFRQDIAWTDLVVRVESGVLVVEAPEAVTS